MITKTKSGRVDREMCCPSCGTSGVWQPEDRDSCTDDWYCAACRDWSDPVVCGPTGGMYPVFDTGDIFNPRFVSRCAYLEAAQ